LPPSGNVADLFSFLWRRLDEVRDDFINDGWPESPRSQIKRLTASIGAAQPGTIPAALLNRLGLADPPIDSPPLPRLSPQQARDYLLVAKAIDLWFKDLHPRYPARPLAFPRAQRYYRELRRSTGRYNSSQDEWVVPKAPLRPEAIAPAVDVSHLHGQFYFLSLARPLLGAHKIDVNVWEYATDLKPVDTVLRIAFIPLAERRDDLNFDASMVRSTFYLDVKPADEQMMADRAAAAIEAACRLDAHICMLPELCVSPMIAERIQKILTTCGVASELRLVVAGSGLHPADGATGNHNECHVFDRAGRVRWRQPKINAYAMAHERIVDFGLTPAGAGSHLEHIRPGGTLHIQESAGLGRMMVLICEDLMQADPGRHAREAFPPDWVFSPILDGSIEPGRWVHQKGFEIAAESHCRVVVANSLTLNARKGGVGVCNFGLCIDDAETRRVELVHAPAVTGLSPVVVCVDWKPLAWGKSTLGIAITPAA